MEGTVAEPSIITGISHEEQVIPGTSSIPWQSCAAQTPPVLRSNAAPSPSEQGNSLVSQKGKTIYSEFEQM